MHDVKIVKEFVFDTENMSEVISQIRQIHGRGGTSHVDVFKRIGDIVLDEMVSTIMFLTDYESDVQQIYTDYSWLKLIPTIWVLNKTDKTVILPGIKTKTINMI